MSLRLSIAASLVLLSVAPLSAQLNPESKTPYLWQIVVKISPHPLLSKTFRDQLKRDLEAALQPSLGALGTVDVVELSDRPRDQWDPIWQQFEDKGFAALEAPRDLSGTKTHFLKLEYQDGLYMLEARQYDGFAGLASGYAGYGTPVIRKQSVRAPEMVGRTAGLMLDRDFGIAGTVEPILAVQKEVRIVLRGGQLGPVDRFVKVGDVFAVSEVFRTNRPAPPVARTATGKVIAPPPGSVPPPGLTAKLRTNALLKVIEVGTDGSLRCDTLGSTYQVQGSIVAFRCMKLGTIDGQLTVRLVSREGNSTKAVGLVSVRATEKGFDAPEVASDSLDFRDGLYRSVRPLSNEACVTVALGPTTKKRFRVPILSADPVNLPYEVDPRAEEIANYERAALAVYMSAIDAGQAWDICFEAMAKLIGKQKNSEALARAKAGYQAAEASRASILDELAHLREAEEKAPSIKKVLNLIKQSTDNLDAKNKLLDKTIKDLTTVVAHENDPTFVAREAQAESVNTNIEVLLSRGDVDEALNAYDQLATLLPGNAEVKARQAKLRAEWKPKSEAHAKAREYLVNTWPSISTIPDFKESLLEFGKNVEECKKQGDKYTMFKTLNNIDKVVAKLGEMTASLDSNSDGDRKLVADATAAGDFLRKQDLEIREFLKKLPK